MGTKPCLQRYQKSRISAGGNVVPGAAGRPHLFAAIGLPEKRQRFYRKEHLYPAAAGDADVDAIQYSHGKNEMVICGIRSQKGTSDRLLQRNEKQRKVPYSERIRYFFGCGGWI